MYGSSLQKKYFLGSLRIDFFLQGGGGDRGAFFQWRLLPLIHVTKNIFIDMVQVYIKIFYSKAISVIHKLSPINVAVHFQ